MTNVPIEPSASYRQTAEEILNTIRQAVQKMDGFAHASASLRRKTGATASLSDDALIAIAAVCDAHPRLAETCDLTSAEIRDALEHGQAFVPVADEFPMLGSGVRYTISTRRASVARRARRLYRLVKSLTESERELLVPHIATLQAAFKKKRATPPVAPDPNAPPADVPAAKKK